MTNTHVVGSTTADGDLVQVDFRAFAQQADAAKAFANLHLKYGAVDEFAEHFGPLDPGVTARSSRKPHGGTIFYRQEPLTP